MKMKSNIKGLGCDTIEIDRIKASIKKHGKPFVDKLFTKKEQYYCQKNVDASPCFAGRFAAKEALVKALGVGFGEHIAFTDIEILNEDSGKPYVLLSDKAKENFGDLIIHISISHSKTNAMAVVILE